MMTFKASRFGLAGGILWGAAMLVVTLISVPTGYAGAFLKAMESVYPGYHVSLLGSIVGLVYGFVDAFIGFSLFAWLYTRLAGNA
ncbi:MAG TPA: bacteriophage holin [bacterium]|nr:bacteriophage holin [bacterium]